MKKFVQIFDNKAHWIFEAEEAPEFAPNIVLLEITGRDDIKEGWNYDVSTNTFSEASQEAQIIKPAEPMNIPDGWVYNAATNTFAAPVPNTIPADPNATNYQLSLKQLNDNIMTVMNAVVDLYISMEATKTTP